MSGTEPGTNATFLSAASGFERFPQQSLKLRGTSDWFVHFSS